MFRSKYFDQNKFRADETARLKYHSRLRFGPEVNDVNFLLKSKSWALMLLSRKIVIFFGGAGHSCKLGLQPMRGLESISGGVSPI